MWQSFTPIGRGSSEISRWKKGKKKHQQKNIRPPGTTVPGGLMSLMSCEQQQQLRCFYSVFYRCLLFGRITACFSCDDPRLMWPISTLFWCQQCSYTRPHDLSLILQSGLQLWLTVTNRSAAVAMERRPVYRGLLSKTTGDHSIPSLCRCYCYERTALEHAVRPTHRRLHYADRGAIVSSRK